LLSSRNKERLLKDTICRQSADAVAWASGRRSVPNTVFQDGPMMTRGPCERVIVGDVMGAGPAAAARHRMKLALYRVGDTDVTAVAG